MSIEEFDSIFEQPELDTAFAGASAKREGFDAEVPDGSYHVTVEKCLVERGKTSGKPMLKWTLSVVNGPHANRKLFRNNLLESADNMKWLKQDLASCGVNVASLREVPAALAQLIGATLEVKVVTKIGNAGKDFRNVYIQKRVNAGGAAGGRSAVVDEDVPF